MAITFVNPYNFIPLAGKKDQNRGPSENKERLLSGKIKYTVKTVTPLFIPNTSNDRYFDIRADHETEDEYHKSFDFFSYTDLSERSASDKKEYDPVIPGSEIRGAVRSLYEALTDSCFSAMDSDAVPTKRTPQRYVPGILSHDSKGWGLQDAEDYICRDNNDFSQRNELGSTVADGSRVTFSSIRRKRGKPLADLNGYGSTGYLIKGNDGPELPKPRRGAKCDDCPLAAKTKCTSEKGKKCYLLMKHNYHVFSIKKSGNSYSVSEESIEQFSGVLDLYEQNVGAAYKEYIASWKNVKKNGGSIPVYYNYVDDGKKELFLSPACITREVYRNTFKKIIGSRYSTCSKEENLCPACRLFGIVNTENGVLKASAIRFADLTVKPKDKYYSEPVTLEELGQPKPSSMEFYLKKPDVRLNEGETLIVWTYDYYIVADAKGNTRVELYDPEIAGRKMYWHSQKAADRQKTMERAIELEKKEKKRQREQNLKEKDVYITVRNKTVRPVDRNVEFEGYLYFDKIAEKELNRLIAILDMSNPKISDKRYAMKLGAAKPLGFGSVETRVDFVSLRKLVKESESISLTDESCGNRPSMMEAGLFVAAAGENLEMLNLDAIDENKYTVHYPFVNENDALNGEEEGFVWFVRNREAFGYKKKPNPRKPESIIDDRDHIDLNKSSANPGERKQVPFRQYMRAPYPVLVNNLQAGNAMTTGKKAQAILFLAGYQLSDSQKAKLEAMSGLSVVYIKEWPNKDKLYGYSKQYCAIALPSNAFDNIVNDSKKYFDHVYKAVKKGKVDGDWACIKQ